MKEDFSLKNYNSFGIDVMAQAFVSIDSLEKLENLIQLKSFSFPHFILGGGSNILFTKNVTSTVFHIKLKGIKILSENNEEIIVQFGAGEIWHECVLWAVENNYFGIENLALIPGTIGAAPMQNIGAYGVEIKSLIEKVHCIHKITGEKITFSNAECEFDYRESIFKHKRKDAFIIYAVDLKLKKNAPLQTSYGAIKEVLNSKGIDQPSLKDIFNTIVEIRNSKLPKPKEIGNAGSFFKNPIVSNEKFESLKIQFDDMPYYKQNQGVKIPAAWLIEKLGFKGYRKNDFGVHTKQALVLVNYGKASGREIFDLSTEIIDKVKNVFGIDLQREVNIY